jgi:hypothetical protein
MTGSRKALPYLAFAVVLLGALNFLWFMAETLPLNLLPQQPTGTQSRESQ